MRRSVGPLVVGVLLLADIEGVALATDAHKLDPHVWTADSGSGGNTTVSRGKLRNLCGDGDGCTVRLLHDSQDEHGFVLVKRHRHWSVAMDVFGGDWSVHSGSGIYSEGSINDGSPVTLLQISSLNGSCMLGEVGAAPSAYTLIPFTATGFDTVRCTLRVED